MIILGGGISGLLAAVRAAVHKEGVTIVEPFLLGGQFINGKDVPKYLYYTDELSYLMELLGVNYYLQFLVGAVYYEKQYLPFPESIYRDPKPVELYYYKTRRDGFEDGSYDPRTYRGMNEALQNSGTMERRLVMIFDESELLSKMIQYITSNCSLQIIKGVVSEFHLKAAKTVAVRMANADDMIITAGESQIVVVTIPWNYFQTIWKDKPKVDVLRLAFPEKTEDNYFINFHCDVDWWWHYLYVPEFHYKIRRITNNGFQEYCAELLHIPPHLPDFETELKSMMVGDCYDIDDDNIKPVQGFLTDNKGVYDKLKTLSKKNLYFFGRYAVCQSRMTTDRTYGEMVNELG